MAEIRIDVRADRKPDLYKIIQWLKKRKIDQATAIENALYDRYMVEVLEDDPESGDKDIALAISSTQSSLSDRSQKLDRKERQYTPSSGKAVTSTWATPAKMDESSWGEKDVPLPSGDVLEDEPFETDDNPQEDTF